MLHMQPLLLQRLALDLHPHPQSTTTWSTTDKDSLIKLSHNNLRARWEGALLHGSVRSVYPIPPSCNLYNYEIGIVDGRAIFGLTPMGSRLDST